MGWLWSNCADGTFLLGIYKRWQSVSNLSQEYILITAEPLKCALHPIDGKQRPMAEDSPVWVPDGETNICQHCKKEKFTMINRRVGVIIAVYPLD